VSRSASAFAVGLHLVCALKDKLAIPVLAGIGGVYGRRLSELSPRACYRNVVNPDALAG